MWPFHSLVHGELQGHSRCLAWSDSRRTDDSFGRSTTLHQFHDWLSLDPKGAAANVFNLKHGRDHTIRRLDAQVYVSPVHSQARAISLGSETGSLAEPLIQTLPDPSAQQQ